MRAHCIRWNPAMKDQIDKRLAPLCLAAIGVVFGDIGTSPLYTLKEVFSEAGGVELNEAVCDAHPYDGKLLHLEMAPEALFP